MFGMMLGKDGKPFKTRAGGTVKLADLLDEARSVHAVWWQKEPGYASRRAGKNWLTRLVLVR